MVIGTKEELLGRIGASVKAHRLMQNLTQETVARRSGVSLTAVKRLEREGSATLGTFVQVCRTIGIDGWIDRIKPSDEPSPIAIAEALAKAQEASVRKRASSRRRI